MVRLLIIATLLAAVAFALWVMWRGTAATDPFAGLDNAALRAQAQQAAAGVRIRPQPADPALPELPPLEAPVSDPAPVGAGATGAHVDEARLRDQTRARAMDEAKQRTPVTAPVQPTTKPWFIPVARPEDPSPGSSSSLVEPTDTVAPGGAPSPRRSAAPAWQRR